MTSVASSMKFTRRTFETNGKLLEARRLHSTTLTSLLFRQELDVERAVDLQRRRDARRDAPDAAHRLEHQRGIAGMPMLGRAS
jgi:hypothetical protein